MQQVSFPFIYLAVGGSLLQNLDGLGISIKKQKNVLHNFAFFITNDDH